MNSDRRVIGISSADFDKLLKIQYLGVQSATNGVDAFLTTAFKHALLDDNTVSINRLRYNCYMSPGVTVLLRRGLNMDGHEFARFVTKRMHEEYDYPSGVIFTVLPSNKGMFTYHPKAAVIQTAKTVRNIAVNLLR